jgi:hypothetical protein
LKLGNSNPQNVISSQNDISTTKSFSEVSSKSVTSNELLGLKKYTVKIEDNELFRHTDKEIIQELTKYEPGVIKQGIINYVTSIDTKNRVLTVNPVNMKLTKKQIEIFTNENENSLFFHTKLDDISRMSQNHLGINCFAIVVNRLNPKSNLIEKEKVILCGNDYPEWIKAINLFKRSSVKIILPSDSVKYITKSNPGKKGGKNGARVVGTSLSKKAEKRAAKDIIKVSKNAKIVADFSKINEYVKNKSRPIPISQSYKLSNNQNAGDDLIPLYYDNTCKTVTRSPIKEAEDNQMTREISKIYDALDKGHIAEQQSKRKFKEKLDEVRKETKLLEQKKESMQRVIQKKELQEKERFEILKNNKKKFEEVQLLKAVTQKLQSLKKKDISIAEKRIKKEIKLEKEKANLHAQAVMTLVDKKDRLLDYSKCVNVKILSILLK